MNMKRIFTLVLVALFVAGHTAKAQTIWDGTTDTEWLGSGTETDPYLISTPEELAGLAEAVKDSNTFAGQYLKLTADIYLNNEATPDSLKREWPIIGIYVSAYGYPYEKKPFCGHFDGDNHIIYGVYRGDMPVDTTNVDDWDQDLTIDATGWYNGFFGYLENATIENLRFDDMVMMGGANVGGLCHINDGGTIRNVHIKADKIGSSMGENGGQGGGLVATNKGLIENCSVDAHVQGLMATGVLVATNEKAGIIRDCSTLGYAIAKRSVVGGFIGQNYGLIEHSSSAADVSHDSHKNISVTEIVCAGFVGGNSGIICDSYATGNVVDAVLSGAGFCGNNLGYYDQDRGIAARIENCYATGNVTVIGRGYVSAFMGKVGYNDGTTTNELYMNPGEVINCFATGKCEFIDYEQGNSIKYGFWQHRSPVSASVNANCYFDADKNPDTDQKVGGEFAVSTAHLQSKEFVDTLNMMSALLGLTKWQYNAGGYPTLTTEKATNLTDYLGGGTGTKDDPWLITNKEQLINFAAYVNHGYHFYGKYLLQTADIAVNAPFEKWGEEMPILWQPIGNTVVAKYWDSNSQSYNNGTYDYYFCGQYDGGLHEVQNLYCYNLNGATGFFGTLRGDVQIRNLGVTDAYVRAASGSGILAANFMCEYNSSSFRQCWTSGSIESLITTAGMSGLVGCWPNNVMKTDNEPYYYNCYSSATIKGYGPATWLLSEIDGFANNPEAVNFLYYGKLDDLYSSRNPYDIVNYFVNTDSLGKHTGKEYDDWYSTTQEMQSKELLNRMNYYVSQFNETHADDPLLFWQYNEGTYPTFTTTAPDHIVTFETNGGSHITPQYVYDNSRMYMPEIPTKADFTFAGWFTDEALTNVFESATLITQDITLYAKWVVVDYTADYSIFQNPFATSYTIKTKEQLIAFAHMVNGTSGIESAKDFSGLTVRLGADILLNDTTHWQQWGTENSVYATSWTPIGSKSTPFNGTFDGQGYTIFGLYSIYHEENVSDCIGLFGVTSTNSIIRNVNIEASCISGFQYSIGLLVGQNQGSIAHCNVSGHIRAANNLPLSKKLEYRNTNTTAGLLSGYNGDANGSIINCHARGTIVGEGSADVGGLVGYYNSVNDNDSIYRCSAAVDLLLSFPNDGNGYRIGGLFGNSNKPIIASYATGNVSGRSDVGGLVGLCTARIDSCYATGSVYCSVESGGGLVGTGAAISNSFATGAVTGGYNLSGLRGEIVGLSKDSPITNCYSRSNVTATAGLGTGLAGYNGGYLTNCYYAGILIGSPVQGIGCISNTSYFDAELTTGDSKNSQGRTTLQMQNRETYVNWDFVNTWGMRANYNDGYPYLQCFLPDSLANTLEAVVLNTSNVDLYTDTTFTLVAEIFPTSVSTDVLWISADTNIVKVHEGILTPITYGSTYVVAASADGTCTDTCWVRVFARPTSIKISVDKIYILAHQTYQFSAEVYPAEANQEVIWNVTDNGLTEYHCSIDQNGLLTAGTLQSTHYVSVTTKDRTCIDTCEVHLVAKLPIQSITLSHNELILEKGQTTTITATVLPEGAEELEYENWSSTDSNIASVSAEGNTATITAKDAGTALIIASRNGIADTCKVTVTDKTKVTSIVFDVHELVLDKGETATISATVLPETANALSSGDWRATTRREVSISADGNTATITANIAGTTLIIASKDGVSDTCRVTIIDPSIVSSVELDIHTLTLEKGQTYTLTATVLPATATNKGVYWYADDSGVVSMARSTGLITANKVGTAAVWVKTHDGDFMDTCYVTVKETKPVVIPVIDVTLNETTLTLEIGDVHTLTATIGPENATNKHCTWQSSASSIVSVDNAGKLTALAAGSATIKVTTEDGGKTATCAVVVKESAPVVIPVTGVSLSETTLSLEVGSTHSLTATITPANATNKTVLWSSNNPSMVSVQDGLVTALAEGEAIVTVTTVDGGYTANCTVTVTDKPVSSEPITVRFKKPAAWNAVYLYAWLDGTPDLLGTWPGQPLTEDADGWYSYTFEEYITSVNFIFNNGSGQQTSDLFTAQSVCYEWNGTDAVVVDCPAGETPEPEAITIRFKKPADWNAVYLYAWLNLGNQLLGVWPGRQLTEYAQGWYSYTFDKSITHVNFIFNSGSGGVQSSDLSTTQSVCYEWDGTNAVQVDCPENTNAVDNVYDTETLRARKVLEDGVIYIIRNGERYMIDGRKVE